MSGRAISLMSPLNRGFYPLITVNSYPCPLSTGLGVSRRWASAMNALQLLKKRQTAQRLRTGEDDVDHSLPEAFRRPPMDVNHIKEAQLPLSEAVHLVRSLAAGHFEAPVAVHVHCKTTDSTVRELRGTIVLPVSFLRSRTLVMAEPEIAELAQQAGAEIVGGEELIPLIEEDKLDFDRVIVTPKMAPYLSRVARILGPRGLMPTVKKGTITNDVVKTMKEQADAVIFKADPNGYISAIIGKCGLSTSDLELNIRTFLTEMKNMKKGRQTRFVDRITIQVENGPVIGFDKSDLKL